MSVAPLGAGRAAAGAAGREEARLRQATGQLEGFFYQELLKAMRETIPEDGALPAGQGQEMFMSLLDEHIAEQAAGRSERGLGAMLYRRFRDALSAQPAGGAAPAAGIQASAPRVADIEESR